MGWSSVSMRWVGKRKTCRGAGVGVETKMAAMPDTIWDGTLGYCFAWASPWRLGRLSCVVHRFSARSLWGLSPLITRGLPACLALSSKRDCLWAELICAALVPTRGEGSQTSPARSAYGAGTLEALAALAESLAAPLEDG